MTARLGQAAARFRLTDRELERMHPGMDLLLDAFALVDCGIAEALARGRVRPACKPGCHACCAQPIPATPLEILALRVFVNSQLPQNVQAAVRAAFAPVHEKTAALARPCPFLYAGNCAAYPVRPIACRRFVVFGAPCQPGEDPLQTRPQDVLHPEGAVMRAALRLTLPWYRAPYALPEHMAPADEQRFFRGVTTVLQALLWSEGHAGQAKA